jgi:hypothetical protein
VEACGAFLAQVNQLQSQGSGRGDDAFFVVAAQRLIQATIYLQQYAGVTPSLQKVYQVVSSLPQTPHVHGDFRELAKSSYCGQLFQAASNNSKLTPAQQQHLINVYAYLGSEVPSLGDKTKGCILAEVNNTLSAFLTPWSAPLFNAEEPNFEPASLYRAGDVLIINAPYLKYGDAGRIVTFVMKAVCQMAGLRRNVEREGLPVVFVNDEAHLLLVPKHDVEVQSVSRSQNMINIMATQSISGLMAQLGGNEKENEVQSLVSNNAVRILHQNNCMVTNEKMAQQFGREKQTFHNGSNQEGGPQEGA